MVILNMGKELKINHIVEVDNCIAKEILELNNKYNILTLHSCCGHDEGDCGFVAVHPENIKDMIALGYVRNGKYTTQPNDKESEYEFPVFATKSVCKCRC